MRRPVAVAITGGIGAGKSSAHEAFRRHGAATVSSDEIVHHLLAENDEVRDALVERLGPQVLGTNGRPDRAAIARIVFRDPEALSFLEGLLHPLVSQEYLAWREQLAALENPPAICVTEVPLLYEVGAEERFDKVAVITAPRRLREYRREQPIDEREDRLLPDREKVRRADFHYTNVGDLDALDDWVAGVMAELVPQP